MKSDGLVQPLFGGPSDIVGDIHGEIEALLALLHRLGYSGEWRRSLVGQPDGLSSGEGHHD